MTEKKYIEAPDLPNVVQGDGRYLMSQLRRYLASYAEQINLANGFKSTEDTGTSGIAAPSGFSLTFSVDGGLFKWNDPSYFNQLAYYELRTDDKVGSSLGLLDRTTDNQSRKMPVSFAGRAYLYAVLRDGSVSNGAILEYNKKRPEKPQDISITKNEQGTLINYTYVPLDCIGAHIYVNGKMFETQDNWLLYGETVDKISEIAVAYYDDFGEGEKGYLVCSIPDVSGFVVERNGAVLDFYWDSVGINRASYVVRVSTTPSWGNGLEIFKTSLLKKKMEYPNTGDTYFLIKACDEHGNFSKNATWYFLSTESDQQKNIIITSDEHAKKYTGNKVGTFYDAKLDGLRLSDGQYLGYYVSSGNLPYMARARSWSEYKYNSLVSTDITISDLGFSVLDVKASTITMTGGRLEDTDGVEVKTYISQKANTSDALLEASLNGTLATFTGDTPTISDACDTYDYGRWFNGLKESELSRLKYMLEKPVTVFSFAFNIKILAALGRCTIAVLEGADCNLILSYKNGFVLDGTDGKQVTVPVAPQVSDVISFGITQSATERTLYVRTINAPKGAMTTYETIKALPVGEITAVKFYR